MKIFLDDERKTPPGFDRTYTVEATIALLKNKKVTHLSLDNDLGDGYLEGFKVLDWLDEELYFDNTFPLPEIIIHSANASRVEYMNKLVTKLKLIKENISYGI